MRAFHIRGVSGKPPAPPAPAPELMVKTPFPWPMVLVRVRVRVGYLMMKMVLLTLVFQGPAKRGPFLILILVSKGKSAKGLLLRGPGGMFFFGGDSMSHSPPITPRAFSDHGSPLLRLFAAPSRDKWPWVKTQIVPPVNIPIPTKTD